MTAVQLTHSHQVLPPWIRRDWVLIGLGILCFYPAYRLFQLMSDRFAQDAIVASTFWGVLMVVVGAIGLTLIALSRFDDISRGISSCLRQSRNREGAIVVAWIMFAFGMTTYFFVTAGLLSSHGSYWLALGYAIVAVIFLFVFAMACIGFLGWITEDERSPLGLMD